MDSNKHSFEKTKDLAFKEQMQRASVSIVSNIAEGVSRNSVKEQIRFIEIAYGSLMEVYCQLYITMDLNYLSSEIFDKTKEDIDKIANKLNALNRSLAKRLNT